MKVLTFEHRKHFIFHQNTLVQFMKKNTSHLSDQSNITNAWLRLTVLRMALRQLRLDQSEINQISELAR